MSRALKHSAVAYFFILPSLLLCVTLVIWPVLRTLHLSLYRWIIQLGRPPRFIGLQNYIDLVLDHYFLNAAVNTTVYVLGTVPVSMAIGMVMAIVLNRPMRLRGLVRGVFFFPTIVSTVVVATTWKFMFARDTGILPYLIGMLGVQSTNWLSDQRMALPAVMISSIWQRVGFTMVVFLAALQGVPREVFEAAELDGSGKYSTFFRVTLPLLAPAVLFASVMGMINGFKVFAQVYVMTGGGPGYATTTIVQHIYERGFQYYDMGAASAASIALFVVLLVLTSLQMRLQGGRAS